LEKIILKTYPFSDPDPVARPGPIYPYFRFHGYSLKGEPKSWNMVLMENPYLEIMVAPEIGGKVWGVREKSTGWDFIYWNPVVKFREIALRGPWTSGGIEFNFGILGHTPTTATPVDFLLEENDDGSVACVVGTMDLPSRTRWYVRIRLPKDGAIIETEGFWFNPTPFHQSLYHWMTAAAAVGRDLRFYHPGQYFIGHDGLPELWPRRADGRDLSYYRNNNFGGSKSYHILGEYGEFFAGLWEEKAFGYGHFAFYPDKPGMKLWLWSQARDGEIWHNLLTDPPAPQYMEMQTGFLYNQTAPASSFTPFKHAFLLPYQVIHWKEFWFPIKGLKKVVAASPSGSLNVEERISDYQKISEEKIESEGSVNQHSVKARFSLQKMAKENNDHHQLVRKINNRKIFIEFCPIISGEKEIRIEADGQIIYKNKINFKPLILWQKEVSLPEETLNYTVILGDGEIIWRSEEPQLKLNRPIKPLSDFDWTSAEGYFLMGEELARQRRFKEAIRAYQNCLQKEPGHIRALTRLAELEWRAERLSSALELAKKALMIEAYDPAANFVYGLINRRLGNFADALDGLSWASRSLDFRSGAFTEMAEIFFLRGDRWRAKEYVDRAIKTQTENMAARELELIICRKEDRKEEAKSRIKEILTIEPLNHLARFEAYLLEPSEDNKQSFLQPISNELPHETFLEMAFRYSRIGLIEEAIKLLELGPKHPLIALALAYFFRNSEESKSRYFLHRALDENELIQLKEISCLEKELASSDSLRAFRSSFLNSSPAVLPSIRQTQKDNLIEAIPFTAVFPYRSDMIPLIEWAQTKQPHWKLNYWLALIWWNLGQEDEAEKLFLTCAYQPNSSSFYLTRADFFLSREREKEAFQDIEKAIELEPKNWRAWHRLINVLERKGEDKLALEKAQKIFALYPENSILILDVARGLLRNGQFKEMLSFLSKVTILPYEGAWEGRDLYRQANLFLALEAMTKRKWSEAERFLEAAKKWPENLGVGKPYTPDERIELYLQGFIYEKQQKKSLALNCWRQIGAQSTEGETSLLSLITALAWKKLGEMEKAHKIQNHWISQEPKKISLQWAAAIFTESYDQAHRIIQNWLQKNEKKSIWNLAEVDHYWPLLIKIFELFLLFT
ncbi:MAG: DUF5107 domain-containing protein, partial [Candidatus Aminicenantes bacterium]|nr:DUF5107 domain-containing protein [Candidatus Aminicenantes bacterium]